MSGFSAEKQFFSAFVLTLLFILLSATYSSGQQNLIQQVDILNSKAKKHLLKSDSLIFYAQQAHDLAAKVNYTYGLGTALKLKGIYEHRLSNFDKAIQLYKQGLNIFIVLKDTLEIGKANLNIAISYNSKNDFVNSLKYGLKSLNSFEALKDYMGKARVLNLIGIAASQQKDYKQAIKYFKEYNALTKTFKDTVEMASSYNNLGSSYQVLGKLDSALFFLKHAAALHIKMHNPVGLGKTYQNIGTVYRDKKDYKNALLFYQQSVKEFRENHDRKFLAQSLLNIGELYYSRKDTVNAVAFLNKALKQAHEINENDIVQKATVALSEIKAGKSEYKAAYENLLVSMSHSDSILNIDKTRAIEELKARYQTSEKEKMIAEKQSALLRSEAGNQKKQYIIWILALAAILLGVVIIAIKITFDKQKNLLKAEKELQIQDAKLNATMDSQEKERNRFAQDIHDGIGQYITGLRLMVSQLHNNRDLSHKVELVDKMEGVLDSMYQEIRNVAFDLMPQTLIKQGLVAAIEEFADRIGSGGKTNIRVLNYAGSKALDKKYEISLYRIIQEWVNNVIKYSYAQNITIQFVADQNEFTLTIEDDGKGFDVIKLEQSTGNGWRNIQTRIKLIDAMLFIDSTPGLTGTILTIDIAVADKQIMNSLKSDQQLTV